jgi:hypothetical protein
VDIQVERMSDVSFLKFRRGANVQQLAFRLVEQARFKFVGRKQDGAFPGVCVTRKAKKEERNAEKSGHDFIPVKG